MRPLASQVVDLPLSGGLAEAVDKKLVQAGAFLRLDNVEHDKRGRLAARRGYGYLTTPDRDLERVAARGQDLVAFDVGDGQADVPRAVVYSEDLASWRSKGDAWSYGVTRRPVSRHYSGVAHAYCLPVGSRVVWVYWSSQDALLFKVEDADGVDLSGERVAATQTVQAAYFRAAASGSTVVIVYRPTSGGGQLRLATIDATTFAVSDGLITLPSTPATTIFDMCAPAACPGFVAVAWADGSSPNVRLRLCTINITTRAVVTSSTGAGVSQPNGANVLYPHVIDNGTRIAVAYSHQTAAPARDIRVAEWGGLASSGTFTTGSTNDKVATTTANTTIGDTNYGAAIVPSQNASDGYFVGSVIGSSTSGGLRVIEVDSALNQVGGPTAFAQHNNAFLYAAPFAEGGRTFWPVVTYGVQTNDTGASAVYTGSVLAINRVAIGGAGLTGLPGDPDIGSHYVVASFCHDQIAAGFFVFFTLLSFAAPTRPVKIGSVWRWGVTAQTGPLPVGDVVDSLTGIDEVGLDVTGLGPGVGIYAEACGLMLASGGLTSFFDGETWGEVGFLAHPIVSHTVTNVAVGTGLTKGTYVYAVHYEWLDRAGNVHQGEPIFYPVDTTGIGAFDGNVNLSILPASPTHRNGVTIAVYRTETATPGPLYRLTPRSSLGGQPEFSFPSSTAAYTDTTNDADLLDLGLGTLYTDAGLKASVAPPPSRYVVAHGNRVWLLSADDPKEIWFSRLLVKGEPPTFCREMRLRIDGAAGEPTALASLDDKLVVLTTTGVFYIVGAGPDDTLLSGSFSELYTVSTTVGCQSPRSVVATPFGVFFEGPRGLMLLTRGLQLEHAGAPVEDTTALAHCRRAVVDEAAGRVMWLYAANPSGAPGPTRHVVFDAEEGAWYLWAIGPSSLQRDQCLWRGEHVACDNKAALRGFGSAPASDASGAYVSADWETPWVNFAGIGGFQRVWDVVLTGRRLEPCNLRVRVYTDHNDVTPTQDKTFDLSSATTVAGLPDTRVSFEVKQQMCSSMKLRFTVTSATGTTNAAPRAGWEFSGVSLEVGVMPGVSRLGATNRR